MATFETRLAKIEAHVGRQIAPDERDPELVKIFQENQGFFGEFSLEKVPCGISAKRLMDAFFKHVMENARSLPVVP